MKREVYYFSGTGNSQRVAADIAEYLGAALIPIAALAGYETVETDAELIGMVFPVLYGYPPVIVQEFAAKITAAADKRVFAVCTFGGAEMNALRCLRGILERQGVKSFAGFGIHMPQNAFHKPGENIPRLLAAQAGESERIARRIAAGATGLHYHNALVTWLTLPFLKWIVDPACKRLFAKQCGVPEDTPFHQVIRMRDCGFTAKDSCTGCGICKRVCPVQNIEIIEGKPVWLHHCENCLACFAWCPGHSIISGLTRKGKPYYYRHPGISLKEFCIKR